LLFKGLIIIMKKALCMAFAVITAITLFGCNANKTPTRSITPYRDYTPSLRAPGRARTLPAATARPRATQLPRTRTNDSNRFRSAGPRTRTYTNAVPYSQYPANAPMVTYPNTYVNGLPGGWLDGNVTAAPSRRGITRGAFGVNRAPVNPNLPGAVIG
jgi:hypothetical protein